MPGNEAAGDPVTRVVRHCSPRERPAFDGQLMDERDSLGTSAGTEILLPSLQMGLSQSGPTVPGVGPRPTLRIVHALSILAHRRHVLEAQSLPPMGSGGRR